MAFAAPVEHVGPGTPAGTLLRRYWHPVAVSDELPAGTARPLRVLGEDFTLYRGEGGRAHVIGSRCAHRATFLHTGSVEEDCLRCPYHGWAFDGSGQCTDQPAEREGAAASVRIPGHPVEEYAGLVFAYLGPDPSPPTLPRYPELDEPGLRLVGGIRPPGPWPVNHFQVLENNVDPVHLAFTHHATQPHTREIPEVEVEPTDDGLALVATRSGVARRTYYRFPSLIQLTMRLIRDDPTPFWFFNWAVPVDDEHTTFIASTAIPERLADRVVDDIAGRTMSAADADDLLAGRRRPRSVTEEDYVVMVGQGTFADRRHERLGRSDVGVVALRRLWQQELDAVGGDGQGAVAR